MLGNSLSGIQDNSDGSVTIGGVTGTIPGGACWCVQPPLRQRSRLASIFDASADLIEGNLIGPNSTDGIDLVGAFNTMVGGPSGAAQNAMSNNLGSGISILGSADAPASANTVEGNIISGNGDLGIRISGSSTKNNSVLSNSIDSNVGLGIGLDSGANNGQAAPVLTGTGTTDVRGSLTSTPSTTFRFQFFANAACDSTGQGEGTTFLGETNAPTNGGGNATFDFATPGTAHGAVITATATDPNGNTSQFSNCVTVTNTAPTPTPSPTPSPTPDAQSDADAHSDADTLTDADAYRHSARADAFADANVYSDTSADADGHHPAHHSERRRELQRPRQPIRYQDHACEVRRRPRKPERAVSPEPRPQLRSSRPDVADIIPFLDGGESSADASARLQSRLALKLTDDYSVDPARPIMGARPD